SLIIHSQNEKDHLVIIEDKTGTSIHPSKKKKARKKYKEGPDELYDTQLEKYYDEFLHGNEDYKKYFHEGRVHLFFYKNDYVDKYEIQRIKVANKGCHDILKNYYNVEIKDKIKQLEAEIKNPKKGNRINDKKRKISEYDNMNKEFASYDEKFVDTITKWNILDINWIYDTFSEFFKQSIPENLILRDYFASIEFWNNQFNSIRSSEIRNCGNKELNELVWGQKSKMWHRLFSEIINDDKDNSIQARYRVQVYNGNYWEMLLSSKDKKTVMLVESKSIASNSIKVIIRLASEKFKEDIPESWKDNTQKRKADRQNLKNKYEKINVNGIKPEISNNESKSSTKEANQICSYTFSLEKNEILNYDTLKKYWKYVNSVFNEIDEET
ncbi:hypothetical protein, partial [Ruminococcus sp.]|uniref:hypothetical protein n=1 Tax=Ruminococcus sp. TaxID=41978 RepID=UPI0025E10180